MYNEPFAVKNSQRYDTLTVVANTAYPYQFPAHDALHVLQSPGVITLKPDTGDTVKLVQGLGYENRPNFQGSGILTCDTSGTVTLVFSGGGARLVGLQSSGIFSASTPSTLNKVCGLYTQNTALPNLSGVYPLMSGMVGTATGGSNYTYPMKTRADGKGNITNATSLSVAQVSIPFGTLSINGASFEEVTHGGRHLVVEVGPTATGDGAWTFHGSLAETITATNANKLFVFDRTGNRLANDQLVTAPGLYFVALHGSEVVRFNKVAEDTTASAAFRVTVRYDSIVNTEGF